MVHRRIAELETLQDDLLQVKKALQTSEEMYRTILESIEEAYFELDLAGNITFFNKAALHMLGYTSDELKGMNSRKYVSPEEQKKLFNTFNKIYRTGKPAGIFDYKIIKKDGSTGFREISASLKTDPSGRPIGFRCVARDVTKRKLAEEVLKKKDEELVIKSRSLADSNTALKVLLKQREEDQAELENNVLSNVKNLIIPYIQELKNGPLTTNQVSYIDTIESNLINIISPFFRNLTLAHFNLTYKEFQVANLIKEGKTTKDIADSLCSTSGAISFHRNNIRKKLGLNNKKINLRFHLLSLAKEVLRPSILDP